MQTRLVEYFIALEREGHFARAAAQCNVSQPTLSAGIAALETQLGKRLIRRDRKYAGLTAEGEAILPWARRLVAASQAIEQMAESVSGPLRGDIRLGGIPAAMPVIGRLAEMVLARHPAVTLSVRALTSRQIEQELAAYELDAGISYLDGRPCDDSYSVPLYREHLVLVSAAGGADLPQPLRWQDIADLRFCLLHQGMQNRQLLDGGLAQQGIRLRPVVTADSYMALLGLVRQGRLHSIMPGSHAALLDGLSWARITPLPDLEGRQNEVGVIVADHGPIGPLAAAVLAGAREIGEADRLNAG